MNLPQAAHLKPLAAGQQLEATVSENRIEPGIKLALLIEAAESLERVEERLLHRVQGVFTDAYDGDRVADRPRLIFFDQVAKDFPIASQAILYRRQIIHRCLSLTYIPAPEKIFKAESKKSRTAGYIILAAVFGQGAHLYSVN